MNIEKKQAANQEKAQEKYIPFVYDSVVYLANQDLITKYIKIGSDKKVGIYMKGQESPYILLDKDSQSVVYNKDINRTNLGIKAEATRIKTCALLNTVYDLFVVKSGWQYKTDSLGKIDIDESALDNRKQRFNLAGFLVPNKAESDESESDESESDE